MELCQKEVLVYLMIEEKHENHLIACFNVEWVLQGSAVIMRGWRQREMSTSTATTTTHCFYSSHYMS